MTFVKGTRLPNQGGNNRWGLKFAAARERYEEKMRKKAEANLSPLEREKLQLTKELEEVQFRADVIEDRVDKCGAAMRGIVDSLKELAQRFGVMIENGQIVHMEVTSPAEAQFVHESLDVLKRQSNRYTTAFNQILSERAGLADRIMQLKLDILQVEQRIQDSPMTIQ